MSCRLVQFAIGIVIFLMEAYVLLRSVICFSQQCLCQPHILISKASVYVHLALLILIEYQLLFFLWQIFLISYSFKLLSYLSH